MSDITTGTTVFTFLKAQYKSITPIIINFCAFQSEISLKQYDKTIPFILLVQDVQSNPDWNACLAKNSKPTGRCVLNCKNDPGLTINLIFRELHLLAQVIS